MVPYLSLSHSGSALLMKIQPDETFLQTITGTFSEGNRNKRRRGNSVYILSVVSASVNIRFQTKHERRGSSHCSSITYGEGIIIQPLSAVGGKQLVKTTTDRVAWVLQMLLLLWASVPLISLPLHQVPRHKILWWVVLTLLDSVRFYVLFL